MTKETIKVIFDTNVWISFLIGKRLSTVKKYFSDSKLTIVITEQLLTELQVVTSRKKNQKILPKR